MPYPEKILIVDDEEAIRSLLYEMFSLEFDDVDEAANGGAALENIERKKYDLIVTDIVMPEVDGMDVLRKAKDTYHDVVVIVMTGQATLDTAIEAVNLGADEYITKPFNTAYFLRSALKHVERQRFRRENILLQRQIIRERDRLKKKYVEQSILYSLTKQLGHNFNISEAFDVVLESLSEAVTNDFCAVFELENKQIKIKSSVNIGSGAIEWLKSAVCSFVRQNTDERIDTSDISSAVSEEFSGESVDEPVGAVENILLKHRDRPFGVLSVCRFGDIPFIKDDREFLERIAEESAGLFARIQDVVESQKSRDQRILNDIPDGFILFDLTDGSVILNPAACDMLCDGDERKPDTGYIESKLNVEIRNLIKEAEDSEMPFIRELTLLRPEGNSAVFDAHIGILYDEKDRPDSVVMALRDVTRERELNRLKSEFISNVSHELRTPAAVIKEFIAILRDGIAGPLNDRQGEYVQIMQNNIERLLRLIDNLLNINRLESGRMRLRMRSFDPRAAIRQVVESMKVRFDQNGIELNADIGDIPAEMYADPDALSQIMTNCLDNARKFSPHGTIVELRVNTDDDMLKISVSDQGRGIAKKDLDRIFDRFYRVEHKDTERAQGSGLGLPIVKEFVRLLGGSIHVESELKKGTTFHILLPLNAAEEESERHDG